MSDVLAEAMDFLDAELTAHASKSITYARGATSLTVNAQIGFSRLAVTGDEGDAAIVRTDRDFLISVGELYNGATRVIPAEGDEITEVVGTRSFKYRVEKPLPGENCWRYSDVHHKRYRIHTRALTVT